jgi:hypothetical protein
MSASGALPRNPPEPWWTMIRLFGSAYRLPLAPAASSTAAIDAAIPMQIVETGARTYCMVS